MALFRRVMVLSHRYLGIAISLLFVIWFASGITMMWAGGMPRLTADERLERLDAVDLRAIRLTPSQAAEKAGVDGGRVSLVTVMTRPAYRLGGATVFADTGDVLDPVDASAALRIAARFMKVPESQVHFVETIERPDQWTLGQSRQMPLHKFEVDDRAATELYVSADLAEVTTLTTRTGRTLAWLGTIPHWFYVAALRNNQPLWYQAVVWTSGLGVVLALLGLILGVTQYRWSRPRSSTGIPYSGWMRWHYVTGVVFGVFTLTWVFSGLLSMEPFAYGTQPGLTIPRNAFTGGAVDLSRFGAMDTAKWDRLMEGRAVKEIELVRIQDDAYYVVRSARVEIPNEQFERLHQPYNVGGRRQGDRMIVAADTLVARTGPFTPESLIARLKNAAPKASIVESALLDDYDAYYYSRQRQTALPILRVKFDDPDRTWVYVDPELSTVVARIHKTDRIERWLYNGLHSLDFPGFCSRRPLWDIVVLTLMLGGLTSSTIGFCLGMKRLWKSAARTVRSWGATPASEAVFPR